MNKLPFFFCCMLLGVFFVASTATGQDGVPEKRLEESGRKVAAGRLLLKWGPYVEKVMGIDRRRWAAQLWPTLAKTPLQNLQEASHAVTYEGMRNTLLGGFPRDAEIIDTLARSPGTKGIGTKGIGDLRDLVYTPVPPCRIFDSRVIGARLEKNGVLMIDASSPGGNFSAQGGSSTDCRIPNDPTALVLSVTGLGNTSPGFVRIYSAFTDFGQSSTVSLPVVNTNNSNDMIVPTCTSCFNGQDLSVYSTTPTHVAITVTGYFMPPVMAPLQCTQIENEEVIQVNELIRVVGNACPAEYAVTGGACSATEGVKLISTEFVGNAYACTWRNENPFFNKVIVQTRCCAVSGRAP